MFIDFRDGRSSTTSGNVMAKNRSLPRLATLRVGTAQGHAGILSKDSRYTFTYDRDVASLGDPSRAISLAASVRFEPTSSTPLLPAFQTSLPEGYLRQRIEDRFSNLLRMDDMAVLATSGLKRVGGLTIQQHIELENELPSQSLSEILDREGSGDLFEELADRYLTSSGIAGVQPKIVVTASDDMPSADRAARYKDKSKVSLALKSTIRTRDVMVKVGAEEYPGLPENEACCLAIATRCGMDVPQIWLSKDSKRFVIERFDFDRLTHTPLGFEDMVSLTGRVNQDKYEGSYELIAKVVTAFCSPLYKATSLLALFKTVALSVILRNGDAHMKNFGLLYSDPASLDIRLSPVYDLVCTKAYLKNDRLALSLGRSRDWPSRETLVEFGRRHCGVHDANERIEDMLDTALDFQPEVDRSGIWKTMQREIRSAAISMLPKGTAIPSRYL